MIDLVLFLIIGIFAAAGYRRGVTVTIISIGVSLVGAAILAAIGTVFSAKAALVMGMIGFTAASLVMTFAGRMHIESLQDWMHARGATVFDRCIGLVCGALFALCLAWYIGIISVVLPSKDPFARKLRSSATVKGVTGVVTPTSRIGMAVLRSGLIPALNGPVILASEPDPNLLSNSSIRRSSKSVVRIAGKACRFITTGTGWVYVDHVVVTNAHVVTGHDSTWVQDTSTGISHESEIISFDDVNDIAVLSVPTLKLPPLETVTDIKEDTAGIIAGFPGKESLTFSEARYDREVIWPTKDIWEEKVVEIPFVVFRGSVRPGFSGSPLLDQDGRVLATVTADAIDQSVMGGFAVPNHITANVVERKNGKAGDRPAKECERQTENR